MTLLKKYRSLLLVLLLFSSLSISNIALAQDEDTTYLISEEPLQDTDTLEMIEEDTEYTPPDAPEERKEYFLQKYLQSSGGGPDSIQFRQLSDSFASALKKEDAFWYVDHSFEKKKKQAKAKEKKSFMESQVFQTILWILIITGFVAFIVFYLANSNAGLFRKANKSIRGDNENEEMPENIFEINYQREIDKAIQKKNFRLATRLMFLNLLKELSDRHIIKYQQDRTNFDYLMQLHGSKYYEDFFRLTRNYEYAWYGLFEIPDSKFELIKNDFARMKNQLK